MVQRMVPYTDGHHVQFRYEITALRQYFGSPLVFLTMNPSDVKHPLTLHYSLAAERHSIQLPWGDGDAALFSALRSGPNLHFLVKDDPRASVLFFHKILDLI